MTRYLLYSGCAAEHDRKPVQVAAIDVAQMLGLSITESGVLACCGARGQAAAEVPDASHLLDPLMAAARQGDTIVCLSPACTQALALHLSVSSPSASEQRSATVCDYVSFVLDAGALGGKLHRTLAPMKVALQAECFAGHRQQPLGAPQLVNVGGIESLSRLVEQTGGHVMGSDAQGPALLPAQALMSTLASGADTLVTPCDLCYADLVRAQRDLAREHPARELRVAHLAQFLRLALDPASINIDGGRTARAGRRAARTALGRHVLYSGCAAEHERRPVRWASMDVAKALGLDLAESDVMACCGARAYRDDEAPSAPHLLDPLLEPARSGQPIVCLSPACRAALNRHLFALLGTNAGGSQPRVQILDFVEFVARAGDFSQELARSLAPLRVALHSVCRADHNPEASLRQLIVQSSPVARSGGTAVLAPASLPLATAIDSDAAVKVPGEVLGRILAYTGAAILGDVSVAAEKEEAAPSPGQPDIPLRSCISLAVAAGADVLVTPCDLCFSDLNRLQRTLPVGDPARAVPVFHLAQILGLAFDSNPGRMGLGATAVSARKVLLPYTV
jgi:heterodisulfide reductase subunit B